MPTVGEKLRALLATGRVANLPTVWSNVLVAFWMGSSIDPDFLDGQGIVFRQTLLAVILIAASLFYVGGCFLGDYRDVGFDKKYRPTRPLPSGILSATQVAISAWFLLFAGLALTIAANLLAYISSTKSISQFWTFATSTPKAYLPLIQPHEILFGLALASAITSYAYLHKRNRPLALVLMSSCRVLLIIFAFALAHKTSFTEAFVSGISHYTLYLDWLDPWMFILALCIGIYTFCLSSVAATESNDSPFSQRKLLFVVMMALPLIAIATLKNIGTFPHPGLIFLTTLIIYPGWLIHSFAILKKSKPAFVSNALAGFCLLDACIASTFSIPVTLICLGLFALALLLQRFTPAT